jgi:hypothetical protein
MSNPRFASRNRQRIMTDEELKAFAEKAAAYMREREANKVKQYVIDEATPLAVNGDSLTWGALLAAHPMTEEQAAEVRTALEYWGDYSGLAGGAFPTLRRVMLRRRKSYWLSDKTRITIDGEVRTTWAKFIKANRDGMSDEKFAEIRDALEYDGEAHGGGAFAKLTIKLGWRLVKRPSS